MLPSEISLPRRYAFRYLQIEVLDVRSKYQLKLEDAYCITTTSADDDQLKSFAGTPRQMRLDQIACHTLRECMQDVFEDGPKRDRRLWMGDLRMQTPSGNFTIPKIPTNLPTAEPSSTAIATHGAVHLPTFYVNSNKRERKLPFLRVKSL